MCTIPISFSSVNSDKINFKKGKIDASVYDFAKAQVEIDLRAFQEASRRKLTNNEMKSKRNYLTDVYNSAIKLLEEKVEKLRDGIVVYAHRTETSGYDMLIAEDKNSGNKRDLGCLNELFKGECRPIGRDQFRYLIDSINPDNLNEKFDTKAAAAQKRTSRQSNHKPFWMGW